VVNHYKLLPVTAKRKHDSFPQPPLHAWAVNGEEPPDQLDSRSSRTLSVGSAPARSSRRATASSPREVQAVAPRQHRGRSQAPGSPENLSARTSPPLRAFQGLHPSGLLLRAAGSSPRTRRCSDAGASQGRAGGDGGEGGKERRRGLTHQLQITLANYTFPEGRQQQE